MRSPLQMSLKKLRAEGWTCEITEHWNPWSKTRKDLFSCGDILAIRGNDTLLVQTTSGSNLAARVAKIVELQTTAVWLESSHRTIVVHGWAKRGPHGKRKTWQCRVQCIKGESLCLLKQ